VSIPEGAKRHLSLRDKSKAPKFSESFQQSAISNQLLVFEFI
jgi:hypothetical protein